MELKTIAWANKDGDVCTATYKEIDGPHALAYDRALVLASEVAALLAPPTPGPEGCPSSLWWNNLPFGGPCYFRMIPQADWTEVEVHPVGVGAELVGLRSRLSATTTAPVGAFPYPHNPAHQIGTCGTCGGEMRYNVPRLGPDGGFVHATGSLDCAPTEPLGGAREWDAESIKDAPEDVAQIRRAIDYFHTEPKDRLASNINGCRLSEAHGYTLATFAECRLRTSPHKEAPASPVAWTREKPTIPGAYWVRGFDTDDRSMTALVEVFYDEHNLFVNLHECNSEKASGFMLAAVSPNFEWQGPLFALPAGQEKV